MDATGGDGARGSCAAPVSGLLPPERVRSALLTAYYLNVEVYGRGERLGAVNGMFPDGTPDDTNLQSQEVRDRRLLRHKTPDRVEQAEQMHHHLAGPALTRFHLTAELSRVC